MNDDVRGATSAPGRGVRAVAAAVVTLVVAAVVLALLRSGPDGPPDRLWTRDPLPPLAAGPPGAFPADVWDAPDGRRVDGWYQVWAPRFGPRGGSDVVWEMYLLESVSWIDGVLARFRGDEEVVADFQQMPHYVDSGVLERRDGTTWRAWDRRADARNAR